MADYTFSLDGSTSGDTTSDYGGLFGIGAGMDDSWGLGNGYGFSQTDSNPPPSSVANALGDLQSGSVNFDWTQAFTSTLGSLVAIDAINHNATGQQVPNGYYRASNGQVYPIGQGPTVATTASSPTGSLFFLLLIGAVALIAMEDK